MYIIITGAMLQRITSGDKMINKLKNGFDKNIVCVKTLCRKNGHLLKPMEWDRFFEFRATDIENFADEVAGYLELKEKWLNDRGIGKFEIILLDVFKKPGV